MPEPDISGQQLFDFAKPVKPVKQAPLLVHSFPGSSHITGFVYNPNTKTLTVRFQPTSPNRGPYVFFNVPKVTVTRWIASGSAGKYFHRNIRNKYSFERIG